MDLFSIITLLGGLAFFLYGMHVMSGGLAKLAGGKLERILKKLTENRVKGMLLGLGVTATIQSSSAVTVMLVGLVNSGIMDLSQSVGVIMGSNIGTTMTAWILSLAGIESDAFLLKLLKPANFALILSFVGILLIMASKRTKHKDIGIILIGFAVLMYGMKIMSGAMSPLAENERFISILTAFSNPLLGVLFGTLITAVIQSSSASVGILQALALTGTISYGVAIPIIMGQNIGTCITAAISSIGVNKNAKRVAVVHASFNIIGTTLFLIIFYSLNMIFRFAILDSTIGVVGIAVFHSLFNVATTILLLPFSKGLVKLSKKFVPDKDEGIEYAFLDERLLMSPSFAVAECSNLAKKMAVLANDTLLKSIDLINNFNQKEADTVAANEQMLDMYEDKLGTFLVKISSKDLTDDDSHEVSRLLHSIGDFERIGDHAVNLLGVSRELYDKEIQFSDNAKREIFVLSQALTEVLEITIDAFVKNDSEIAAKVEPLEQVIDTLISEVKTRHIERLQCGRCTIELGFILSDLLNSYERVSDHCSNIAVAIIEMKHKSLYTHEYLRGIKSGGNEQFQSDYEAFLKKYPIEPGVR